MSVLLSDLAARFFAYMEGRNAPGTVYYYRLHINRFVQAVGNVNVAELRRHHLIEWGKCWHSMQAVQRLFNWAHGTMELIERNPFAAVKRPRPGRRRRVLERAQVLRLLRFAAPELRAFLIAMCETISRPQEVRALRWDQLRWDAEAQTREEALISGEARFELTEYKARERMADPDKLRVILVTARLGRLLSRLLRRGVAADQFVFRNQLDQRWTSNAIRLRVRRLCNRAQLPADDRGERIVAYTLRHTSATNACVNGVPDRVLAELMGHTNTRTTARYQHLSIAHLRAALRRLRMQKRSGLDQRSANSDTAR